MDQRTVFNVSWKTTDHEIQMGLFDLETSRMVLEEEANLKRFGYRADEIKARIGELGQQREDIRQANQEGTDAAIDAARQNAANRTAGMIRDHNRQVFDSFKRQAEGVFDALLTKSQSIWSAIGNSFKTALLTAIKDVVSSRVAAILSSISLIQRSACLPPVDPTRVTSSIRSRHRIILRPVTQGLLGLPLPDRVL